MSHPQSKVSLKRIAELLNTSECTVSKALHNKPKVSAAMREKVWQLAKELGYQPNVLAQSMARRNPVRIRLICARAWPSYYRCLLEGVEQRKQELQDYRLKTEISYYEDMSDVAGCIAALRKAYETHCDAIILLSGTFDEAGRMTLSEEVARSTVPVFLLGGGLIPNSNVTAVINQDSGKCGRIAGNLAEILLSKNDSAAVIVGRRSLLDHQKKYEGFCDALLPAGIQVAAVADSFDQEVGAYQAAIDIFSMHPEVSLLYVATENISGILFYLKKFHLENKIKVIATGTSEMALQALRAGTIRFIIDENPFRQGEECMNAVFQSVVLGQPISAHIAIDPVIRIKNS